MTDMEKVETDNIAVVQAHLPRRKKDWRKEADAR